MVACKDFKLKPSISPIISTQQSAGFEALIIPNIVACFWIMQCKKKIPTKEQGFIFSHKKIKENTRNQFILQVYKQVNTILRQY